jgi:hypothetical protein
LAAGAESSKVDYKPLHHAGNCNEYRANTDQYVCNFACLYFRSPRLARQAQFCDWTLSPLSGPLKTIMAVPINRVKMLISNSLLPYAFPKVALRELQVNVWVIFLSTIMSNSATPVASLASASCELVGKGSMDGASS